MIILQHGGKDIPVTIHNLDEYLQVCVSVSVCVCMYVTMCGNLTMYVLLFLSWW